MQTKKMSLVNIQARLTRAEMKKIMAGSGSEGCGSCTYKTADGYSHTVTCSADGALCVCPDGLGCGHA